MTVLVTGANGSLGRALFQQLGDPTRFRAAVRSERAAQQVATLPKDRLPEVVQVDYTNARSMQAAAEGCETVVHLVGIIKETRHTRYADAHEASCSVLAQAAASAGVERITALSIVGSAPDSPNACLASRGRAERILLDGTVPATVLRVPMVLGRGDPATRALFRQATAGRVRLVSGGRTRQQPIDARDVVRAIAATLQESPDEGAILELAGPECLAHRDLVTRAARVLGAPPPQIGSIPLFAARAFARVAELALADPPITLPMLGVLQHDDDVSTEATRNRLGIELTPLDETLAHYSSDLEEVT